MKKISNKLIALLILSALVPMITFGIISIWTSRQTTYASVSQGNLNVALRAAEQIELYVSNSFDVLKALAENINRADLKDWQKERVIKNYVINFEEFEQIYITDKKGKEVVTTILGMELTDRSGEDFFKTAISGKTYRSEVFVSDNLVPTMTIAVPLKRLTEIDGVIAAEINLVDMWHLVDSIRIGEEGYAFVVSHSGLLIAHGEGDAKALVLQEKNLGDEEVVQDVLRGRLLTKIYPGRKGEQMLGVTAPIDSLGWGVIIEQPTSEAFRAARIMTYELTVLITLFLLIMVSIGFLGGRQIVRPIRELIEATGLISRGDLSQRVEITTRDELSELGRSFDMMRERLSELQEEIRRQERSATFGRIAAGLVHDLRTPIKNIENSSRLIQRMFDDEAYRKTFQRTVEREFTNINRFLDDLYDLTHPAPLQPISINLHKEIQEIVENFQGNGVSITANYYQEDLRIYVDKFALERVVKNIINNAIQAIPGEGELKISTRPITGQSTEEIDYIEVSFTDDGCGISPERLKTLFDDYTTTKKKGLGLGLAVSKTLVEQMKGSIKVESEMGKGTTFYLRFPAGQST
ncbi:MAG: HAMP domain-containing protein [Deltaproteobacteria bacterium]|nr:MAG: HAMP domain-containing protein [Deltaproteobacteria bacterium]